LRIKFFFFLRKMFPFFVSDAILQNVHKNRVMETYLLSPCVGNEGTSQVLFVSPTFTLQPLQKKSVNMKAKTTIIENSMVGLSWGRCSP